MPSFRRMAADLGERRIAQDVTRPYDDARMAFRPPNSRTPTFPDFEDTIGQCCDFISTQCVSHGSGLSRTQAVGQAKEFIERHYRRHDGTIVTAFNDARDGTNGGLKAVLDIIADGLKNQAIERYVREVFDREVVPNSWEDKVEIIRQFLAECGPGLSSSINVDEPERYAADYQELIQSYVAALQRTASIFRRL